jgi:hypothetical protein
MNCTTRRAPRLRRGRSNVGVTPSMLSFWRLAAGGISPMTRACLAYFV